MSPIIQFVIKLKLKGNVCERYITIHLLYTVQIAIEFRLHLDVAYIRSGRQESSHRSVGICIRENTQPHEVVT